MAKSVRLSGYLPGGEHQNLGERAEELRLKFEETLSAAGEAHVIVPVVGMLKVSSVQTDAAAGHLVDLKFVGLEAPTGKDAGALRDLWRSLHQARNGQLVEIEGIDGIMHGDGSAKDDDEHDGDELAAKRAAPAAFSDTGEAPGRSTR